MKTLAVLTLSFLALLSIHAADTVDASSLRGKVLCGYQGWFRCPGDAQNAGWIHWSRDGKRIAPETLTFEMWPDLTDFPDVERFTAPGFSGPDGRPAQLFSSDNAATVRRHFEWMRDYGIDGVWLQHFLVDFPEGPAKNRYASRLRVLNHVRQAAQATGRVWALTYDVSGMTSDKIFDAIVADWKKQVDDGVTRDDRYVHQNGKPVLQIFGFYHGGGGSNMTLECANRLVDFLKAPGPYSAFVAGGGDWNWRRKSAPEWLALYRRLDAYSPWNTGNTSEDPAGVVHATTNYWAADKADFDARGALWIPVVYPGFSWDNLQKKKPGETGISRRDGAFLWEQFYALSMLGADSVFVAMFDEVDEGTAIFKVTSTPPTQAHFQTFGKLPSDGYLWLVGEATKRLHAHQPIPDAMPSRP